MAPDGEHRSRGRHRLVRRGRGDRSRPGRGAGAAPDAWRIETVLAPLAVGWVVQALLAAWTHLLPSIGPGGPAEHARQRALLGRLAVPRLAMLNGGTALLALGLPMGSPEMVGTGGVLVALAVGASLGLTALAVVQARGGRSPAHG